MRLLLAVLLFFHAQPAHAQPAPEPRLPLQTGWTIQSSADVLEPGAVLSTTGYRPQGWYRATMPSTVLHTLVENKVYPDPNFGINLRSISGSSYPIADNFSNSPMPPDSPFRRSWWFRTEFPIPAAYAGRTLHLHFDGINYRANVWLNGHQIASSDKMAGAWRLFEFDVTEAAVAGAANALAVEIFPPQPDDLAITFVDWNPQPPDKNMGLWRETYLTASGPVAIRFPFVVSRLNLPSAQLTVFAELRNSSRDPIDGVLKGHIDTIEFAQPVRLAAGETRVVSFTPDKFPQLALSHPRLWWPVQTGPQNLYTLRLEFETTGQLSDRASVRFGVREVTSELDAQKHRVFSVNGKRILIRGAGYSFDMLLRGSPEKQRAELDYVRDMNLNTVRLEGKIEDDHFFDLCDEYGILVLAGWCCCDHWEKWADWKPEDHTISAESLRDQIRRLRSHPSVFDWLNGSDNPPPPDVERNYIRVLQSEGWPNPYQSSATEAPTTVTGATGVKMTGPYEYVPPAYWLLDHTRGGAHGFNTETSPGPAVPPIESLRQMLPEDRLWPINSWWDFHAGGGPFKDLKIFTAALNARYGASTGVEDYALKAQVMAYEGQRAMFEAFGRNKYTSTGVIQWMLNNAWPSMIWHLYDYYLRPGGGYFGTKKACEPLHVQYSYDDGSVVVVNSRYQAYPALQISTEIYTLDMIRKFSRQTTVDVPPDTAVRAFTVPKLEGLSSTYFVRLTLTDPAGGLLSSNFYWLSTSPDILDWDRSTWYVTPSKSFADLGGLATLPKVDLKASARSEVNGDTAVTRVTLQNPSRALAFFVHLKVSKSTQVPTEAAEESEILPMLWEDNYFPLMPGEKRAITATYRAKDLGKAMPLVDVDGWNVRHRRL